MCAEKMKMSSFHMNTTDAQHHQPTTCKYDIDLLANCSNRLASFSQGNAASSFMEDRKYIHSLKQIHSYIAHQKADKKSKSYTVQPV